MSDDGGNTTITTATADLYSNYYDGLLDDGFVCDSGNVSAFGKVFHPTLYSLVFILGFLGNGLVVCVLVKHRKQTNLTDICLLNLALSDLLFIVTLPFYAHFARVGKWIFGVFMCRFATVSYTSGFFSSIFFMTVMTLDRYMVVMHAHIVAGYRTVRAGVALSVAVWILSLSVSLPAFFFTTVTNELNGQSCHPDYDNDAFRYYNVFTINVLGLGIPLLVMVACYSRILPTLVNMRTTKKHRIVKLIISVVVVFFLFWAPYNICVFLDFLRDEGKLPAYSCEMDTSLKVALSVTEAIAYTHSCLNPIIYAFVGQRFMKRALQLLRSWTPWLPLVSHWSDSSFRKSSVMSRSSEVTPTFIK